jgi:DMSO/TMAO reductase YedYZ heme-binding membrane subunit
LNSIGDRLRIYRLARNVGIATTTVIACAVAVALWQSKTVAFAVSFVTAYVALLCFTLALCIGPWHVLRGTPLPLSSFWRRDLGIWTAILGTVHTVFGLGVHMGNPWLYFFRTVPRGSIPRPRIDAFGLTNDLGLVALAVLLALLTISNNRALRRMGAQRWKAWQRWSYWAAIATAVHAAIYQVVEQRGVGWLLLCWSLFGVLLGLQYAGRRKYAPNH